MKTAFLCSWAAATFAVVWEPSDFGIVVNIAAVAIMGVIAWLVKKGVTNIEDSIDQLGDRLTRTNGRLRIAELNIEAIAAKHGIKSKRYVDPAFDDTDQDDE